VHELAVALEKHDITYELVAFVHMANVIRICPLAQAFPSAMEFNNPFHGYVYWYLVLDFLCYCVMNYSFRVPGLSTTDAVGGGLSSCAKVRKLATEKKAEMVAAMESRGIKVPDLNDWFYKVPGEATSNSRVAATLFRAAEVLTPGVDEEESEGLG
jgi:hypothetical protein